MYLVPWLAILAGVALGGSGPAATIVNSGSTNMPGFRISVERSGIATHTTMARGSQPAKNRNAKIPAALLQRFFADLEGARPLSELPAPRCMKSASFGTTLTVEFAGQSTPDLSCGDGGNAKLQALIQDSGEIVKLFDSQ